MRKKPAYESYEIIAEWFDKTRGRTLFEKKYLELVSAGLPAGSRLLDLGCGTGEPLARYFIQKGFQVTGLDGSAKMIALCQQRFPEQRWIVGDMCDLHLQETFDVLFSWGSFFFLTPEEQRAIFPRLRDHCKPGGRLLFNSGSEAGEVWSNNGGEDLYHASLDPAEYRELLAQNDFKVLVHAVKDAEAGDHTVWIAERLAK